jgi:peptidoglycan/xylan/chitin deacetylase (PgdA/CDA1 family)
MYHEIAAGAEIDELARRTQRGYILPREEFELHMAHLAATGYHSISLRQLHDWSRSGAALPPKPIVITFDDGFAGNFRHAVPVLRQFGLTGTFFVVTNRIEDPLMLTWPQLREMHRHGMSVESHTANHPLLSTLTEARTREELADSKHKIEDELGSSVTFLSLPNGDSNPYYARTARELGYSGGCASQFGFNLPSTDCYFWRRIAIKQGLGFDGFRNIVSRRRSAVIYQAAKAAGKAAVARAIGKRTYDRLYNFAFGVQEQDKSKQP